MRTRGLWTAGYLALVQGNAPAGGRLLEASLLAAESQDDAEAVAYAAEFLGRAAWFLGDPARGLALTEDALARHRAAGDWRGTMLTLVQLGIMRALMGDPAEAISPLQECAGFCEARGERWNRSYALWGLGLAAWLLGDAGRAGELECDALRIKREVGDQIGIGHVHRGAGVDRGLAAASRARCHPARRGGVRQGSDPGQPAGAVAATS